MPMPQCVNVDVKPRNWRLLLFNFESLVAKLCDRRFNAMFGILDLKSKTRLKPI